jgi:hypothetical protein
MVPQLKDVSEYLSDLPSRAKLGDEVRTFADDLERVRSPRAYRHLLAGPDEPSSSEALLYAERAFVHEKPLFLAEMPVQRTPVPATAGMHVCSEEVSVRLENLGMQLECGTLEDVAPSNAHIVKLSNDFG